MKAELQIDRVEKCMLWLIEGIEDPTALQSKDLLIERLTQMCSSLAFVNNQMAIAKLQLNQAYEKAYAALGVKRNSLSPTLAKNFINAQCSEQWYNYDVCERCSRTIVHTIDSYRTCISALKVEQQYSNG